MDGDSVDELGRHGGYLECEDLDCFPCSNVVNVMEGFTCSQIKNTIEKDVERSDLWREGQEVLDMDQLMELLDGKGIYEFAGEREAGGSRTQEKNIGNEWMWREKLLEFDCEYGDMQDGTGNFLCEAGNEDRQGPRGCGQGGNFCGGEGGDLVVEGDIGEVSRCEDYGSSTLNELVEHLNCLDLEESVTLDQYLEAVGEMDFS